MDAIGPEEFVRACKGISQGPVPSGSIGGVSTDSRSVRAGDAFFALVGEKFDGHDYVEQVVAAGAAIVVASRREVAAKAHEKNWPVILVDDTVAALGRLASWYRNSLPAKLIAITGSNGKTTTKAMLQAVLSNVGKVISAPKSFNNNIGVPLTLLSAGRTHNYIVLEIGTNHPGEIAALGAMARPDMAIITSVGSAHIGNFGSVDAVAKEKTSLLEYVPATGFAAVNIDEPAVVRYLKGFQGRMVTLGTCADAEVRAEADRVRRSNRAVQGQRAMAGNDVHGWSAQCEQCAGRVGNRHPSGDAAAADHAGAGDGGGTGDAAGADTVRLDHGDPRRL